jgi:rubrerythrin
MRSDSSRRAKSSSKDGCSLEAQGTTTSGVVSFAERLEERSAMFYERLSKQFPAHADLFQSFTREDKLNKVLVRRTYQETVTDALETGYSFEGVNLKDAVPDGVWKDSVDLAGAVNTSLVLEQAAVRFYGNIADRSQGLLSTMYTAFRKIEGVRKNRLAKLESLREHQ